MEKIISRSQAASLDKFLRLKYKIEAFNEYIHRRCSLYFSHIDEMTQQKLQDFDSLCSSLLYQLYCGANYFNTTKTVGKVSRIDKGNRIYIEILKEVNSWGNRKDKFNSLFNNIPEPVLPINNLLKDIVYQMSLDQMQSRYAGLTLRLYFALVDAYKTGKYVLFGNLTVDSQYYKTVFSPGSNAWAKYIRNIKRHIQMSKYGSRREAERRGDECLEHFAVVERGSKGEREHIHTILIFNDIAGIRDPNQGKTYPTNRLTTAFSKFWPYGWSDDYIVRFGQDDAWGKKGFQWPLSDSLSPIAASHPGDLCGYMVGYLTKSLTIKRMEDRTWRIRLTKRLGMKKLDSLLSQLPMNQVTALCLLKIYPAPIKMYNEFLQTKLLRSAALRVLHTRLNFWKDQSALIKEKSHLFRQLWKITYLKKTPLNYASIIDLQREMYANGDISDEIIHEFMKAKAFIERHTQANIISKASAGHTSPHDAAQYDKPTA
jgi:hypothetical protein